MRKRDSKRRWLARARLGKPVPWARIMQETRPVWFAYRLEKLGCVYNPTIEAMQIPDVAKPNLHPIRPTAR